MTLLFHLSDWVLTATLRASALAVAILAIRLLLRRWLPVQGRYLLWLPMLAAMAVPALIPAPFRLFPRQSAPAARAVQVAPVAAGPVTPVAGPVVVAMAVAAPPVVPAAAPLGLRLFSLVWLTGAAGVLAAGVAGYLRQTRRIERTAENPGAALSHALDEAARAAGLRRTPRVRVSPEVESPAVTGFLRPRLLLPAGFPTGFSAAEERLILLHEFSHLKRHDLAVNALACLLQAIHWFNPLLWFALARMRQDREAACDARVLSLDSEDRRAEYGGALLKLQALSFPGGLSLGFVGIFPRGSEIRDRILDISGHRPGSLVQRAGCAGIVALLAWFGATRAAEPDAEPQPPQPPALSAKENPPAGGDAARLDGKLDAIVIPEFTLKGQSLKAAIEILLTQAREHDPERKGLGIVTVRGTDNVLISLNRKNVTIRQVLAEICSQTAMRCEVGDTAVVLAPKETVVIPDPQAKPLRILESMKSTILPAVDLDDASIGEAAAFLTRAWREVGRDATLPAIEVDPAISKDPKVKELHLRQVPLAEALRYVVDATHTRYRVDDSGVRFLPAVE